MKYSKILTVTAIAAGMLMTTTAFASGVDAVSKASTKMPNAIFKGEKGDFKGIGDFEGKDAPFKNEDQLTMLENRKANIETLLKNGKITDTQASAEIAKLDGQIKELKEFNALTLDEKKAKLTADLKATLDAQVKNEDLTQKKADEILKNYTDRLANWDGTGYPKFKMPGGKGMGFEPRHEESEVDPVEKQDPIIMLELRKLDIQAMQKDGKITEAQATEEITTIDKQIEEIKAFNALTLDQKKAKLTADFKAVLDKQVADGKLTQAKADEMLKNHTDRLADWDGTGYPMHGMLNGKGHNFGQKGFNK